VQYFLTLKQEALDAGARAEPRAGFTRKDYMQVFKTLSTATASRDLNAAVKSGVLKREGEGNQARYNYEK
jgi:Fic family protein